MNREKIIEAIDTASNALAKLKEAISEDSTTVVMTEPKVEKAVSGINTELLAKKVAYAYNTLHPEYKVDNQFNNLSDMIRGNKITYVISWLKRKNIEGIEDFFKLTIEQQRSELLDCLYKFEKEIKLVFEKRFS